VPWVWIRKRIAEAWHCKPWEVDDAPMDEILLQCKLMNCESEAAAYWAEKRRQARAGR
jgi:hypothetical protein